jgi:hypothetical protein
MMSCGWVDADMMLWWQLWRLLDDAPLAFALRSLACTGRCDLARLHELANVS